MQAGAHMVKLEGGGWTAEVVRFLVERGIPVCAHLGLTPQTVHALGGYRVQGKTQESADLLKRQAHELQDAGASMLVLEMVPAPLSRELTTELKHCATIGIGAGNGTAGQVLVLHDMLGVNLGKNPKFVRNFMDGNTSIRGAMEAYVAAVKDGSFPVDAAARVVKRAERILCHESSIPSPSCALHSGAYRHPAVVPTMGNLHDGHLALVRQAKPLGRRHRLHHLCEPAAICAARRL